jgi:hypothetical protein
MEGQDDIRPSGGTAGTTSLSKPSPLSKELSKYQPGSVSNARAFLRTTTPSSPTVEVARNRKISTLHSVYDLRSAIMALDSSAPQKDPTSLESLRSVSHDENSKDKVKSSGGSESDLESETSEGSLQSVLKKGRVNWQQISGQLGPKQKAEDEADVPIFDGQTVSSLRVSMLDSI